MANHSRRLDRLEERNRPNTRRVHLVIGDSRDGQEEQRREMIAAQAHENDLFIFRLIVSVMAEVLRPIVRWLCDKVTLRRRGWPSPQGRYCARCAGRARFQVPAATCSRAAGTHGRGYGAAASGLQSNVYLGPLLEETATTFRRKGNSSLSQLDAVGLSCRECGA
jgi:hypothetical protein